MTGEHHGVEGLPASRILDEILTPVFSLTGLAKLSEYDHDDHCLGHKSVFMKPPLRPVTPDEAILRDIPQAKRREIPVNPDGGFFDAKTISAALRRASPGDVVLLPNGDYPAFELRKDIAICSADGASPVIKGTIRINTKTAVISGIRIVAEPGQAAVTFGTGTLLLKDSTVSGALEVGSATGTARLFVRNCLLGGADEGILLTKNGALEMSASRITGCRIGIAVREGAECAVYHSRIENCRSDDEADPGAGIFAEQSSVYCEGVTLSRNGVGAYLQGCTGARFLGAHFHASDTAAVISSGGTQSPMHLRCCTIDDQASGRCAQIALDGGAVEIAHTTVYGAQSSALSVEQASIELLDVRLNSREEAAFDARTCQLTGSDVSCRSTSAAGIQAAQCHGILRNSSFTGLPPTRLASSPQLLFDSCHLHDARHGTPPSADGYSAGAPIELVLDLMRKRIGQHGALAEIERILRLAHASRQRRNEGLPAAQQSFHCVFMGPRGCGKLAVAQKLAEGLHAMGVVSRPEITEFSLLPGASAPNGDGHHGVLFIRARQATGSASDFDSAKSLIEQLVSKEGDVVILEGEREDIRRVLRSSPILERAFRNTLFFNTHGPAELAGLFAEHCAKDHITPDPDTKRALLLMFHIYSDRRDKRFATESGVDLLYEAARRRYLERSSLSNRIDLPMEPRDLDIPQDRALRNAMEKSPAFVSFCPSCRKENPWVPGLDRHFACFHCDTEYAAEWGIWKESATYRRMHEAMVHVIETGAVTRRANLPTR
jgi:hypothetical protein